MVTVAQNAPSIAFRTTRQARKFSANWKRSLKEYEELSSSCARFRFVHQRMVKKTCVKEKIKYGSFSGV